MSGRQHRAFYSRSVLMEEQMLVRKIGRGNRVENVHKEGDGMYNPYAGAAIVHGP
jgi:hypothetical protein